MKQRHVRKKIGSLVLAVAMVVTSFPRGSCDWSDKTRSICDKRPANDF